MFVQQPVLISQWLKPPWQSPLPLQHGTPVGQQPSLSPLVSAGGQQSSSAWQKPPLFSTQQCSPAWRSAHSPVKSPFRAGQHCSSAGQENPPKAAGQQMWPAGSHVNCDGSNGLGQHKGKG